MTHENTKKYAIVTTCLIFFLFGVLAGNLLNQSNTKKLQASLLGDIGSGINQASQTLTGSTAAGNILTDTAVGSGIGYLAGGKKGMKTGAIAGTALGALNQINGGEKSIVGSLGDAGKNLLNSTGLGNSALGSGGITGLGAIGDIGAGALAGAGAAKLLGKGVGTGALIGAGAGLLGNMANSVTADSNVPLAQAAAAAEAKLKNPCVAKETDPLGGALNATVPSGSTSTASGISSKSPSLGSIVKAASGAGNSSGIGSFTGMTKGLGLPGGLSGLAGGGASGLMNAAKGATSGAGGLPGVGDLAGMAGGLGLPKGGLSGLAGGGASGLMNAAKSAATSATSSAASSAAGAVKSL